MKNKKDKRYDIYEIIAKNIKFYRKSKNMTQAQLAEKTEYSHEFIRRILPKGTSFDNLTQSDINLMINHINSYTRATLDDKCTIEVFEEIYGAEILKALEVTRINPNDITLLPELLK